jgi:NAD(P)-dependent dehydrogenase (short-subunit alcohol dehydrogenase family)
MFVSNLFAGKKTLVTGGGTGLGKAMRRSRRRRSCAGRNS